MSAIRRRSQDLSPRWQRYFKVCDLLELESETENQSKVEAMLRQKSEAAGPIDNDLLCKVLFVKGLTSDVRLRLMETVSEENTLVELVAAVRAEAVVS